MALPSFDALESRASRAVQRRLSNATVRLASGGPEVSALYDRNVPDGSPFQGVATVAQHVLSLCIVALGDPAEGDEVIVTTRHWPDGQLCQITTPVEPDAGGWATFDIVPVAGQGG